jgi:hypothetical protein
MPFVLDASVSACWTFDGEDHPTAALAQQLALLLAILDA